MVGEMGEVDLCERVNRLIKGVDEVKAAEMPIDPFEHRILWNSGNSSRCLPGPKPNEGSIRHFFQGHRGVFQGHKTLHSGGEPLAFWHLDWTRTSWVG